MIEKGRRDFCIECRKETEYILQKKDIVKNIRDQEYTFAITVAVCTQCGEEMSIPDIFATYGEEYFRNLETELLKELQTGRNCIISCGGGVALRSENVVEMKKNGKVVLLTASPETIYERVKDSNDRPLLKENKSVEFIAQLMEKRKEKYEDAADVVIRTDGKTILQICEELITRLMELEEK